MTWQKLTKAEVRKRWPGEMAKEIIKGMKAGWTVKVQGNYAHMICGCPNTRDFKLAATPGRGASSAALKIRDQVAGCPEKHKRLGSNRLRRS